jgi:putative nucleotidyltransferase with HDIG domain
MLNIENDPTMLNLSTLIAKVKDLPPLPTVVMKALELIQDPEVSIRDLQQLISQDQALSAKMLRIVNSAVYSLRREISTVSHAVDVLGIETVKSILMATSVEGVFQTSTDLGTKLMSDHSWGTAIAARAIARRVRYENPEEAMICGLMHDIGKPVLMQNYQSRYSEIVSEVYKGTTTFSEAEIIAFGFSHAHVGALLARKWNFPIQLSDAVGYHHTPMSALSHIELASIINLADLFMISMGIGVEKNPNTELDKQPASEFLKLDGAKLAEIAGEIQTAVKSMA